MISCWFDTYKLFLGHISFFREKNLEIKEE